jgi:hypothetical protein
VSRRSPAEEAAERALADSINTFSLSAKSFQTWAEYTLRRCAAGYVNLREAGPAQNTSVCWQQACYNQLIFEANQTP